MYIENGKSNVQVLGWYMGVVIVQVLGWTNRTRNREAAN